MKKYKKISIVFLVILLLIIFYLIITTEKIDDQKLSIIENNNLTENNEKPLDIKKLQDDYTREISKFYSEYLLIQKKENVTNKDLLEIEDKLLALKVPTEFKELHIKFILAISKMKQYLENNDEKKLEDSKNIIKEIKLNNSWID
jgi:hypothetical protein